MVQIIGRVVEPQTVVDTMQQRSGGFIGRTGFTVPGMEDAELAGLFGQLQSQPGPCTDQGSLSGIRAAD